MSRVVLQKFCYPEIDSPGVRLYDVLPWPGRWGIKRICRPGSAQEMDIRLPLFTV